MFFLVLYRSKLRQSLILRLALQSSSDKIEVMGNSQRQISLFVIVVLPLLTVYQNCGQSRAPANYSDLVYKIDTNAEKHISQASLQEKLEVCQNAKNYICEERNFSPNLLEHSEEFEHCLNSSEISGAGGQDVCFHVKSQYYDSSAALRDCPSCTNEDSLPGGRYNYQEARCYNFRVLSQSGFPINKEGSDLTEVVKETVNECFQTVQAF